MQLISDLALSFIYDHRHQFSKNHIFVAPHACEASGDNAIPQVLAEVCALVAGAKADTDIVQTTKVFHTGGGCQYSCPIKLVACQPIPTQAPQFLVNKSTLPQALVAMAVLPPIRCWFMRPMAMALETVRARPL